MSMMTASITAVYQIVHVNVIVAATRKRTSAVAMTATTPTLSFYRAEQVRRGPQDSVEA